jgi:hypothetical protein
LTGEFNITTNYVLDQFEGKTSAFWRRDKYNVKGTLDWRKSKNLKVKGVGLLLNEPTRQLGVGLGLKFLLDPRAFSIYNTILWYHVKNAKILLFQYVLEL